MKKTILFLGFLLLAGCGYQPIFSNKDSNFLIEQIEQNRSFDHPDSSSLVMYIIHISLTAFFQLLMKICGNATEHD